MSCDECFDLTDRCVEDLLEKGEAPGAARRASAGCPACSEDVFSLLTLVAAEHGTDVAEPAVLPHDSPTA